MCQLVFLDFRIAEMLALCIAVKPQPSGIESAHLLPSSAVLHTAGQPCGSQIGQMDTMQPVWRALAPTLRS